MSLDASRRRRIDPLEPFVEGCTGKLRYATKGVAKQVIRRMKSQGSQRKIFAYRCENCGGIHLTSHPKSGRM